jgi:hypothetical protein
VKGKRTIKAKKVAAKTNLFKAFVAKVTSVFK